MPPTHPTRLAPARPVRRRRPGVGRLALAVLFLFAIGAGVFAGVCVRRVLTGLEKGASGRRSSILETPFGGKKKVFLLILGVDDKNRLRKTDNRRSDTMILAQLDMEQGRVAAMSLPRDTRVHIPGHEGHDKLNAAHNYGGVPLVRQTVAELVGVPIDRYLKTDVNGFRALVDLIGPVEIDVEKRMDYDDNWGNLHIHLKPGKQLLNGEQAMGYVRFRKDATGDLGRMKRQQKFLRAVARKMFTVGNIARLPRVIDKGMEYVETDLTPREVLSVARLFSNLTMSQIATATYPGTPRYIHGVSFMVPDAERAEALVKRLFFSTVQAPRATIEVLNGNGLPGIAGEAALSLRKAGFHVSRAGDADNYDHEKTEVRTGEAQTPDARRVAAALRVGEEAVVTLPPEPDPPANAPRKEPKIVVVLGKDYRP